MCGVCGTRPATDGHGFCDSCGGSNGDAPGRHLSDLGRVAGVTASGPARSHNDDAFVVSVAADGSSVAVVCDGVGSSPRGGAAALAAARAAGTVLTRTARAGDATSTEATTAAVRTAIDQAGTAVSALADGMADPGPPPACTLVAAVASRGRVTVGWVGDSRAYWVGDDATRVLTVDDSRRGRARSQPAARTDDRLTRWLGADAPPGEPHVVTFRPQRFGRLVLCTDGVWSALPQLGSPAALAATVTASARPATTAGRLADLAVRHRDGDDATVVVCETGPR
jgi:serine/threonine protein phosphatase PrpC